mmetsp:Transcript_35588/g.36292  ORF Transcript_35588/g.36292 Transcript_35588/m.36292 type:complete len:688 (+) Transcript_35588:83-2146(+)
MGNCCAGGSNSKTDNVKYANAKSAATTTVSAILEGKSQNEIKNEAANDGQRSRSSSRSSRTADDMEKEVQSMLAEEQKKVRIKARPLMERRISTGDTLMYLNHVFASKEDNAASKIQRCVRRYLAVCYAMAKQDWMIFCNMDSMDEASKITNTEAIPTMDADYKKMLTENDDFDSIMERRGLNADDGNDVISAERQKSMEKFLQLKRLEKAVYRDIENYSLPASMTPKAAAEFIEVMRRQGKLEKKSLHRLLGKSYRSLRKMPNISQIKIVGGETLTIVGDLHGQLDDLLYILDTSGMPSITHKYLFNGDFVDRGDNGVEVMCILLVLNLAMPGSVYLNRGNHEDFSVCCLYGFQGECCEKYDETTFGMFSELFQQLPLVAVVNDAVFVVHGGLFHANDVTLEEINRIDRSNFSLRDVQGFYHHSSHTKPMLLQKQSQISEEDGGIHLSEVEIDLLVENEEKDVLLQQSRRLQRLQLDLLWSDPANGVVGAAYNPRGVAIHFGPDYCKSFLDRNGLAMIVRSHEAVLTGFEHPYSGENKSILATLFSASDYGGGKNVGAYMDFYTVSTGDETHTQVRDLNLWYSVRHYSVAPQLKKRKSEKAEPSMGLIEMIRSHHEKLLEAFTLADDNNTGEISKLAWADVMQRVTGLKIRWLTMIPFIVADDIRSSGEIDYKKFIKYFTENEFGD